MFNRKGASSQAGPSTRCQKCLQQGHYSYECTASQQDRPYVSRPSRSQQLQNPKLAPNLTSDVLQDEKPGKSGKDPVPSRSASLSSGDVSMISRSRSRSPAEQGIRDRRRSRSNTGRAPVDRDHDSYSRRRSRSPVLRAEERVVQNAVRTRSRSPLRGRRPRTREFAHGRQRNMSPYSRRIAMSRGIMD